MIELNIAKPADAPELVSIYRPYVLNTAITFEYDVPTCEEFAHRIEKTLKKYPYITAREDGCIVGYAYAGVFKQRQAYDWSAETSVYVKEGITQRGIGTLLYRRLEQYLSLQNITNLNACITYPNDSSIAFHERMGYVKAAHFHKCGYKLGEWRDMIWMEKFLCGHPQAPQSIIAFPELLRQLHISE